MTRVLSGTVHGQFIEITEQLELPEGTAITLVMNLPPEPGIWGEGIRQSSGSWEKYPEVEDALRTIQENRKLERRPQDLL